MNLRESAGKNELGSVGTKSRALRGVVVRERKLMLEPSLATVKNVLLSLTTFKKREQNSCRGLSCFFSGGGVNLLKEARE